MPSSRPPVAPRRPHEIVAHGRVRVDDWYWLADRDDPAVLAYLEAENQYTDEVLAPTKQLQESLFEDIKGRVRETDAGPPTRHGPWWYFSRTVEGKQYPIMCRRPDPARTLTAAEVAIAARSLESDPDGEQVLLDENLLSAGKDYMAVGVFDVSPDHDVLAYAVDLDGSELYSLRFRDLETGIDLPDVVEGVYYGSAWARDNKTFFYVRTDEAMRPWQVWRHELGRAPDADVLVFQENDERFFVGLGLSRSEMRIVIESASKTTSEAQWVDSSNPTEPPRPVLTRQAGVEYDVEHDGESWLIRTNRPGSDGRPATNFALYRLPERSTDPSDLEEVVAAREDVKLESVDAFAGHVVVGERSEVDGLERLRVFDRADGSDLLIEQPEAAYSLLGDPNPEWDTTIYRFGYTSLVTPRSSIEFDMTSQERTTVWAQEVPGGYDADQYRTERLWAKAEDGTRVPISVVARRDQPVDGTMPCLLYGYGAYEITIDPSFSPVRLNLLERGISYAIAHVRGGGELGRTWYEQGRMEHKRNTFTDFIAAATHLVDTGWANPTALVARGGSAGGLLMGAVTNLRPDLWSAVVAEVPFVDVVTTMSDTSLPLTVTEWEEWGDPVHDGEAFDRMLSYAPYENVPTDAIAAGTFPALFVTAGLNDPRVGYWEPAKWVAKLRAAGAGSDGRPILLRTELGAGHQGPSGRYDVWRDEARVQAFILRQLGRD
jgi:oligopeptidase B